VFPSTYQELWQVYEGWNYGPAPVLACARHELAYEMAKVVPSAHRAEALMVAVQMLRMDVRRELWTLKMAGKLNED